MVVIVLYAPQETKKILSNFLINQDMATALSQFLNKLNLLTVIVPQNQFLTLPKKDL